MCDDILDLDTDQNLALLPVTQGEKPPFLLIAVLMGPQGQYQKPKEIVLFPVASLCTVLKHKIKRKLNMREPYFH